MIALAISPVFRSTRPMKPWILLLPAVLSIFLSSCSGFRYALKEYQSVKPVRHTNETATYRVFDRPEAEKMMITPTIGRTAGLSYVKGLTLGIYQPFKEPEFRAAAESFLIETGRPQKEVIRVWEIFEPQWEATYRDRRNEPR